MVREPRDILLGPDSNKSPFHPNVEHVFQTFFGPHGTGNNSPFNGNEPQFLSFFFVVHLRQRGSFDSQNRRHRQAEVRRSIEASESRVLID